MGDDLRRVKTGAGVDAAYREAQLAHHQFGLGSAGADRAERAAALAVHAHALGKRVRDEESQPGIGQGPHRISILGDAIAETLVGQVEIRQQLAIAQHRDQRIPLRSTQVDPGRVVAAGVQQHDAALGQAAQGVEHRVETQPAAGRIEIRVAVDLETAALEHRAVVVPGRVADPDRRVGQPGLEEISADFEPTRRTHGLYRRDPTGGDRRMARPEQQLGDLGAAGRVALHRQVGLGACGGQDAGLGQLHAGQHRQPALLVEIDADRQVDLGRPRIGVVGIDQREDRIARIGLDMFEHRGLSRGWSPDYRAVTAC